MRCAISTAMAVIGVFNTNDDVVEMLRIALENAGFIVISAHIDQIKRGHVDLEQFVREHKPKAIVYDIAPPYDRQWAFLEHLRKMPYMDGVRFVLTCTNPMRVKDLVQTDEYIHEIIGKP